VSRLKKNNKFFRTIPQLLVIILVASYFSINLVEQTFATNIDSSPNVIVTIDGNGSMSQHGNLFNGSLFPASVQDAENGVGSIRGVIRIVNNYEKIDIENISIGLNLSQMDIRNNYPPEEVYNSFLDNIRLRIEKGKAFTFNKILVDYINLRNLLFDANDGEYTGYNLVDEDKFSLNKGDTIDLKYTLQMVEEAGNELQSITAYMPIYINLQGDKKVDGGGGDGGNGGIPPIDIPVIDGEEIVFKDIIPEAKTDIEDKEIVIEDPIPESQLDPEPEVEEVVEEEIEPNEEIPQPLPNSVLPKTGSASPLISVGIGSIILGIGLFLKKKKYDKF
jgi:LPXTG-motif cell wall-anchored protein